MKCEISRNSPVYQFRFHAVFTVSLVLFAFIFCIIWSIIFNFKDVTKTHCKVINYLPSISSAFDEFSMQTTVWRLCVALHAPLRFLVVGMYYRFYKYTFKLEGLSQILANVCCALNSIENVALVGLSFISSTYFFTAHRNCFIIFGLCSEIYMLLSIYVWKSKLKDLTLQQRYSFSWKIRTATLNILSGFAAAYLYYRHNKYCEPLMYTWFCLAEYIVVVSNMGFHMTAYWDFYSEPFNLSLVMCKKMNTSKYSAIYNV